MVSLSSKWVHPTNGFDIDSHTLARHLGRVVRFGGAVNTWYSVLQHSLFVAEVAGHLWTGRIVAGDDDGTDLATVALAGLLHDAHEFLKGDVPTDWKTDADHVVERKIDDLIRRSLGVDAPSARAMALVKEADEVALVVEGNYISPYSVEVVASKFSRPDLIRTWYEIFWTLYCPDPYLAFQRNWDADGIYVKMYEKRLTAAIEVTRKR